MLIECYDFYLLTLNEKKKNSSSKKKMPNLTIIKILKLFKL